MNVNRTGKQNTVVALILRVGPPEVVAAVKITKHSVTRHVSALHVNKYKTICTLIECGVFLIKYISSKSIKRGYTKHISMLLLADMG